MPVVNPLAWKGAMPMSLAAVLRVACAGLLAGLLSGCGSTSSGTGATSASGSDGGSSSGSSGSSGSGSSGSSGSIGSSGGGSGSGTTSAPSAPSVVTLPGRVQVGSSAIGNAHLYLLAAGTGAPGTASISLLDPTVAGVATDALGAYLTTDAEGGFDLSDAYHCTPGQQVYLLAHGGTVAGQRGNDGLSLLSVFGACPASGGFADQIAFVNINQVSTVVSVYALAGLMTDATHVSAGASGNAQAGLANAFAAFANLMSVETGVAYADSLNGSGVVPLAEIDTLANMLVPCSNAAPACPALFAQTTPAGGAAPTDTAQAMLSIVRHPAQNVAALFALAGAQPLQPALAAAPNDWTLAITYYAQNLAGAYFPAIDAAGNVWVPGYANNTLTEFDGLGHILSGSAGFSGGGLAQPVAAAIDGSGNVWVTSFGAATPASPVLSEFAANGNAITSNGFACGVACMQVAIDGDGDLWVSGKSQVSVVRSSGTALSAFSINAQATGVAIDSQGRGWAIGSGRNLSRMTLPATVAQFTEGVTSAAGESNALAIDAADNIWFTSPRNNAVGKFSNAGAAISPTAGYTGGGLSEPVGIAVDGAGQAWVANRGGSSVSAFSNSGVALSPASGYQAAGLSNPRGIAVDPSGNVWLTDFTGNAVTELLGAATPAATPITPANHGQLP